MKSRNWMWALVACLFAALAMPAWTAAQNNPSQHKPKHHTYQLSDLGTFGGPDSFAVQNPSSQFLSNSGMVAGCADTPVSDPDYPNFNGSLNPTGNPDPLLFNAFRWNGEVLENLGTLPGANSSCGLWISNNGLVAGGSENGLFDPLIGIPEIQATLWRDGHLITLGSLGGYESVANSVNDRGQVVGAATNTIPDPTSGFGTQLRAFLWQNGVMQDLGTLGGPNAFAVVVNKRGQVFGAASTPSGAGDGFLWDDGKMQDIPDTLGGNFISPYYLNNRGQVVGTATLPGDVFAHPFFWEQGVGRDLGTFGGDNGDAEWVNEKGQVIGSADFPGDVIHHGLLWQDGKLTDLGTLNLCSRAHAINSDGQIVGASSDCHGSSIRATLWENGEIVDLNTLISSHTDLTLVNGENINDRGEITGKAVLPNGDQHVYLLIPDGDCNEDCEGRIAASKNTAAQSLTAMPSADSPAESVNQLRNPLQRRFHVPGQPTAPPD